MSIKYYVQTYGLAGSGLKALSGVLDKALAKLDKSGSSAEPKDKWALFSWQSCLENLNYKADVCLFGDSLTRGFCLGHYFPDFKVCNLGYSGDSVVRLKRRVGMVKAVAPDKVFIMVGINDLLAGRSAENIIAGIGEVINQLPEIGSIYIQSLLPINTALVRSAKKLEGFNQKIAQTNAGLQAFAEQHGWIYIDLFSHYIEEGQLPADLTVDGLHLKPEAYDRWAEALRPYI